jgi:DNA-binding NarL/FixJ family response regulator
MIRVLIADDQALVRGGFKVLVDSDPECTVVAEAADGVEAIALAREHKPDVVLMDIRMPNLDGLEAARVILEDDRLEETKILVLTTFDLDEYVFNALRIGASGFLLKDTEPAELLAALKVVAAGEGLLAPSVTRRVIAEFANRPSGTDPSPLELLTEREREVLAHVGRGLTNAELAETLFVSVATAKTHVSRLMMKLGARDRAQLVVCAYETGLVTPGS